MGNPASINVSNALNHKDPVLLRALQDGNFETALQVLSKSTDRPVGVGPDQLSPLHFACEHGRLDVVEKLVSQYGYDIPQSSLTLLQVAAERGHVSIVVYLLGKNVKPFLKIGVTNPLHLAVSNGYLDVVKILVESNILRSSIGDQDGNTPLHHAAIHGHLSVAAYLSNVANHPISPKNKKGETPLHLAAKHGHFEVLKFLVDEKGCDPTVSCGKVGCTPLHLACKCGNLDIVKYLSTEKSCNPECKTHSPGTKKKSKGIIAGRTPLHYASYSGHLPVVSFLVSDQSCNPLCTDGLGFTPLHLACQEGHYEVVQFLVECVPCKPNSLTTEDGKLPLHLSLIHI